LEKTKTRNRTYRANHKKIRDAYLKLIEKNKRCPTVAQIMSETKLSDTAIETHIKEMEFEPQNDLMRSLTPDVLLSIYESAKAGKSASQKLWLQVMEGFREGVDVQLDVITVEVDDPE